VAGQFGWYTNMWQMAYLMWTIINRASPPTPPFCDYIDWQTDPEKDPETFVTWGPTLHKQPAAVDQRLRTLVALNLIDELDNRMNLEELLETIEEYLTNPAEPGQSDEEMRTWSERMFSEAPPPAPQDPLRLEQVSSSLACPGDSRSRTVQVLSANTTITPTVAQGRHPHLRRWEHRRPGSQPSSVGCFEETWTCTKTGWSGNSISRTPCSRTGCTTRKPERPATKRPGTKLSNAT
jgi:hypothetical protein